MKLSTAALEMLTPVRHELFSNHLLQRTDPAVKARALQIYAKHPQSYLSDTVRAEVVAKKIGTGRDTDRR